MRSRNIAYLCTVSVIVAACGTKPLQPSDKHIQRPDSQPAAAAIPQPLKRSATLPPPKPAAKAETYSVIVTNLPAQEILFTLARDAKINLDIHPGIQGTVTLNALNQTLPQILSRIAKQVDMRYELDNGNLVVMPDTPYLNHYKIDYVNMARDSESSIVNSMQVSNAGSTASATGPGTNNSSISVKNTSRNHFWETLVKNIEDILRETDKEIVIGRRANSPQPVTATGGTAPASGRGGPETNTAESDYKNYQTLLAASVIANPETGIITVRATGKQHGKIQEFLDQIMSNARRQVMIEATIVEVRLNDNYQQGINWSALIKAEGKRFKIVQGSTGLPTAAAVTSGILGVITNPTATTIAAQVSLLETFGTIKVLSSPKLSVLNNQTAVLKVVDNLVYFTIKADTTTNQTSSITTFTTTPNTVPIGFTMSVTPQISDSDSVLFNLKPSISRLLSYINDPNPSLATAGVVSRIPQTQTREMESVLKIDNNQIAVMGGLMQDEINNNTDAVPGLSGIPVAGNLFTHRNDTSTKTELVIFLRPMVIKDASLEGDFSAYRDTLPDRNFFKGQANTRP